MPQCSAAGPRGSCGRPLSPTPRKAKCPSPPSYPPAAAAAFIRATRTCPADPCCPPADCLEPIMICPPLISPKPGCGGGGGTQVCRQNRGPPRKCRRSPLVKPRIDCRIYRNGEHLCISYAGHVPGEQYIHGRNLPTTTTFAKRRLKTYTPYEFVDPDGCCSFP